MHIQLVVNAKTKVMQTRCVGIVWRLRPCVAQHITEVAIVVLDMVLAVNRKLVLFEAEHSQHCVVKLLRNDQVRHRNINMVDTDNFGHVSNDWCTSG